MGARARVDSGKGRVMLTIQAILTAAASGPDAVKTLCERAGMTDDRLRAAIDRCFIDGDSFPGTDAQFGAACGDARQARAALAAELSRRSLVDPGWECERCGHVNPDDAEYCAGEKCVAFREWAAQQPQEDQ